VLVAAGVLTAAAPAFAAPITDGTSNTLELSVTSATLDQAHHRVLAISRNQTDLTGGIRLASVQPDAPHMTLLLTDVTIESITGTSSPAPGSTRLNVKYTLFLPDAV
jgi:hypothetical protein